MKLTYFNVDKTSHLVEDFYHIVYSKKIVPLNATIIPLGNTGIAYIYSNGQKISLNNNETVIKNLIINGQFYKSYKFNVSEIGSACGLSFKPTALHKLTGLDISKFSHKYSVFNQIDKNLADKFENIFINHNNDFKKLFAKLEKLLLEIPIIENKNTIAIDKVLHTIHLKEGMISVNELLNEIPFGQKTLETLFKKMVGLTPAKYIRIFRFKNLMKQYESNKIDLKDLIYMYNYYDESHFAKDFKAFTSKSFKDYFKDEFTLIKKALKKP
ncbi:AraC family transcriptional regulator [Polaribacter haliotis]|uniref:AraC family transcriptional regulator n=1 Tax=Polaribacter haliotis TaxID=1888915 RepID=A0A7L8AGF9_9FLAO|nr:helix-turn-helix domain-containing protein [Polaribacter haliotis]QOD61057.1 AraC family transcriptional regulator [Polaribacter haliotis]